MTYQDVVAAIRARWATKPYRAVPKKTLTAWLKLADDGLPPALVMIMSAHWTLPQVKIYAKGKTWPVT